MNMFKNMSVLIECSAGRTPTVKTVKNFIRMLSAMGYTELYLGCTDAYKIDGQPYFNYKRGGYTTADFREMDEYAKQHGIELIANIQTLGHLHFIGRHETYRDLMDNDNIMLVGDERVYDLVDKMFGAISKGLSSRRIHIGSDECWGLGLGNYLKRNGPADKKELLLRHLKRVLEIAEKYGYTCEIWHDMLIETQNTKVTPEDVKNALPDNVTVFYWDYFEIDKDNLRAKLDNMLKYADNIGYAGSAFKCGSMAPLNYFSIPRLINQMQVAHEKRITKYMVTLWSDNGAWVENYDVLPALYACAEYNLGRWDGVGQPDTKLFRELVGIDYDDMISLDLLDDPFDVRPVYSHGNRSFWIMLSDIFNGGWDLMLPPDTSKAYEKLAERYREIADSGRGGEYAHLFVCAEKFARVLSLRCLIGVNIRRAYYGNDKIQMRNCLSELSKLSDALKDYSAVYAKTWLADNMPFGLEIDQIFLGGQLLRIDYIISRLNEWLDSDEKIGELEAETVLPDLPLGTDPDNYWNADWKTIVSNCGF